MPTSSRCSRTAPASSSYDFVEIIDLSPHVPYQLRTPAWRSATLTPAHGVSGVIDTAARHRGALR